MNNVYYKKNHILLCGRSINDKKNEKAEKNTQKRKTKRIFRSLGNVAKNKWGLGHRAMRTIYKGVYIPIVTYAAIGWADKMTEKMRKSLASSQRQALIRVTKAYRTVSTESMPVVAGVYPIDIEVQKKVISYKIRRRMEFNIEGLAVKWNSDNVEETDDGMTVAEVCRNVEKELMDIWQDNWTHSTKGRTTFNYFRTVHSRLKASWIQPNFYTTQFLTGHGNFNSKLSDLNIIRNENCNCGERETPEHMLFECREYDIERIKVMDDLRELHINNLDIDNLIKDKRTFRIFANYAKTIIEREDESMKSCLGKE